MITVYMKPTNRCNVGCTHCYLPEAVRADRYRMPMDTVRSAAEVIQEMAERGRHAGVFILWHGGEPLVVPPDWYWSAGELLDQYLPGHDEGMQTSLIPLTERFIPLIKRRFNGGVGSSIDFSQRQINGSVEGYHKLWMHKVDLARSHDIVVIPGVVPTTRELGREAELVNWFVQRDFTAFNIDRYNAYQSAFPDRPSNLQHSRFLIGLFDALMAHMEQNGRAPLVGAIRAAITGVLFGVGGDRWGGSCMADFVVVEPNGDLNNCPDKSTIEAPFSNVAEGYDAFAKSKFRRKWVRHQALDHKMPHCQTCENQSWCHSGCPITPNGIPEGEDECSGYWTFLSYVRKYVAKSEGRARAVAYLEQARQDQQADRATIYGGGSEQLVQETCS